jgi:hypothetical protein
LQRSFPRRESRDILYHRRMSLRAFSLAIVLVGACSGGRGGAGARSSDTGGGPGSGTQGGGLVLPPVNARIDYQLGGAYPPSAGVAVVTRDRSAQPAPGLYDICYINGFQIQPDEEDLWLGRHPELILRDAKGDAVVDPDWNEMLIDVRPAKQAAVATVVGEWIAGCKSAGFDAVEIDNLDAYTRSNGILTADDAVKTMRLFADRAHEVGMPIAQKNSAELVDRRDEMGTDFAVAEECNRYSECDSYTASYGEHVLVIEYRRQDFDAGCAAYPDLSIVLRDRMLLTPASSGYVYEGC